MEGSCSTGQSPQWAVVPVEEEEEEEDKIQSNKNLLIFSFKTLHRHVSHILLRFNLIITSY
jgi:hypothetical protein